MSKRVATELQDRISSGEWPVGSKIPAEPELVAALGVSRSTLREAVRSLAQVGMLETRPGDGTYVRSDNALRYPLLDRIAHAQVRDVLEIRAMFEEYAARLAAQRCTPAGAEDLRSRLADIEMAAAQTNSMQELLPVGLALFRSLSEITGNQLLTELYQHLAPATPRELMTSFSDEYLVSWQRQLAELVDAISANDPDRAEQIMRRLQIEGIDELT
ncbi:FadR/GntR family transcriptional regulator [Nocardia sp. NPDC050406]|uniref:FadR/GntR family transcriptional regulator n=1 Tax=Nocardia sp. NPDC050406 TaxID=3364318 RepID=UPI0037A0E933